MVKLFFATLLAGCACAMGILVVMQRRPRPTTLSTSAHSEVAPFQRVLFPPVSSLMIKLFWFPQATTVAQLR